MKLRIEDFPGFVSKYEIQKLCEKYGVVLSVKKKFGESIAIVTMPYEHEALKVKSTLNGSIFFGEVLKVTVERA